MNPDNTNLESRIAALEAWKKQRETQQIVLPLDKASIGVLEQYFMRLISAVITEGGAGGNTFIQYIGQQGNSGVFAGAPGMIQFVVGQNTFTPYIVDTTSNIFTTSGTQYWEDDMQVFVATSNTPPAPLDPLTGYYIISSTGTTFKLSLTQGGAEINITDTGVGNQFVYFF